MEEEASELVAGDVVILGVQQVVVLHRFLSIRQSSCPKVILSVWYMQQECFGISEWNHDTMLPKVGEVEEIKVQVIERSQ